VFANPDVAVADGSRAADPDALRHEVATACRIAAFRGLCEDVLGHVSVRSGDGVLIRCRGPLESGLLFTTTDDVRQVGYDGALAAGEPTTYSAPNEVHIHTEILKARPDVEVVLHAHPPAVVAADLAGLELRPIVGAYNIPASRMARLGIPTYPRSVLVNTPELGRELAETMGDRSACVLRGHGIVTTGATVAEAISQALSIDALARMTLRAASAGRAPEAQSDDDLAQLPDLGSGFNDAQTWRFQVASLAAAGFDLS
jgi:ribulose-5-phosphate 4-epimerase/fuculose-1-phosphate aldolase